MGPEVSPGRVAVTFTQGPAEAESLVVDLNEERVVETLPGLDHLWTPWGATPVSGERARHFFLEDGSIVRRDFATGEVRVVAGRGAPPGERLERD
jgi:hypothetical protein